MATRIGTSHAEVQYDLTGTTAARTLAVGGALTLHSLLVVTVVTAADGTQTVSVSDSANGAYTQAGGYVTQGNGRVSFWFIPNNSSTGTPTISVTPNIDSYVSISVDEYTGCATTGQPRATISNTDVNATLATSGNVAAQATDLIVAGGDIRNDATASVDSPFTISSALPGTATQEGIHTAYVLSASGPTTATFRWTGLGDWGFGAVAFVTLPPSTLTASLTETVHAAGSGVRQLASGTQLHIRDLLTVTRLDIQPSGAAADASRAADDFASSGSRVELEDYGPALIHVADVLTVVLDQPLLLVERVTISDAVTVSPLSPSVLLVALSESVHLTDAIARGGPPASIFDDLVIEAELNGLNQGWTDLKFDLARNPGVHLTHGIDGTGPSDRLAQTPTASFSLLNAGTRPDGTVRPLGLYSPFNANCRPGWDLNIRIRVRVQNPADGTWSTQFLGKVDLIVPDAWLRGPRLVKVQAVGWFDDAAKWQLVPEIGPQVEKRWDEIATAIIAQMSSKPVATQFDRGMEPYPIALDQSDVQTTVALTEFGKLVASEYGYGYELADGTFRLEGRHRRMVASTVLWTIDDTEIATPATGLDGTLAREQVLNAIHVVTHQREVDLAPTSIVYAQTNAILIPIGTKSILGSFRDEVTGDTLGAVDVQVPLLPTRDYLANELESGMGKDLTAGLSIVTHVGSNGIRFDITNAGATDAWLTFLQVLGRAVKDHNAIESVQTDPASIATYGEHVVNFDMPYQQDASIGEAAAIFILSNESMPKARALHVRVAGRTSTLLTHILTRDLGDLVHVRETVTGIDADFYIQHIEKVVRPSGVLEATYRLVSVRHGAYWHLGVSALAIATIPAPF